MSFLTAFKEQLIAVVTDYFQQGISIILAQVVIVVVFMLVKRSRPPDEHPLLSKVLGFFRAFTLVLAVLFASVTYWLWPDLEGPTRHYVLSTIGISSAAPADSEPEVATRANSEQSHAKELKAAHLADREHLGAQGPAWWCLCYKERVDGVATLATACRKTHAMCLELDKKISHKGSRALVKGSVQAGCQRVSGAHPSDATPSTRRDWMASSKNRGWWSATGCWLDE